MAYTDDGVKAKLSALNETQEGIVSCSQWIMFHRRYADRTAQLWMQRIKDSSSSKRLNLIYLANEVIQQSKARRKDEFARAFSPIIAEATSTAYKGATNDIQQKIRRVMEVWRQRQIFEPAVQDDIEQRVDEIDRTRSTTKKPTLGGSLFSSTSSFPPELQSLVPLQTAATKAEVAVKPATANADTEYNRLTDPNASIPTPPVHAARLSALLKTLATAEGAVAESIKARQGLIDGLERILASNKAALLAEEDQLAQLRSRRIAIEVRKSEVEDNIMRGLSAESSPMMPITVGGLAEPPRPEIEALTPPPVESITPIGTPPPAFGLDESNAGIPGSIVDHSDPQISETHQGSGLENSGDSTILRGLDPGAPTLQAPTHLREDITNGAALPPMKKRKMNQAGEDFADFANGNAMEGLDDDVAAMLGA